MRKSGLIPADHNPNSSNSSSSSSGSTPRHFFIPILTPSSTPQPFCIPKSFLKYLQVGKKKIKKRSHKKGGGEVLEAILRSNGRGKSFHVKIIVDKDGRMTEQEEEEEEEEDVQAGGWKDFSAYHELHVGDFLLFRHLGSLSFDVIVFDSTACQREYPPPSSLDPAFFFDDHITTEKSSKNTTPDQAKRADAAEAGSSNENTPSNQFTTPLKYYNFSQFALTFPAEFVRSNGLGNKNCTITFRDEKGRSWPIDLRYKKSDGQVYIRGGWRHFIEGNGLKQGDVCTFELVSPPPPRRSQRRRGTKNIDVVFDVRRAHH